MSRERNIIFSSNKKNWLHIKGYFMAKNTFVAKVTFKDGYKFYMIIEEQ